MTGYAGFWRRVGATLIDGFVLTIAGLLLDLIPVIAGNQVYYWIIWLALDWVYHANFHSSAWQATPGKRAFAIKVTDLEGERIGFGRASARYFATWLSALMLMVGYLVVPFTRRRQAVHDMIAGTLVVGTGSQPGAMPADREVAPLPGKTKVAVAALIGIQLGWMAYAMLAPVLFEPAVTERSETSTAPGPHETLEYAIYEFPLFGGERKLVKQGTRTYARSEIETLPGPAPGVENTVKILHVAGGFDIHASVYREASVDGFGLSLSRSGAGFSWEWFDRASGDIYRKRQGSGQVQVRFKRANGLEEMAEILFLDDVTMRLDRYMMMPFTANPSDLLVVKKGSVLWLSE